MILSFLLFSSTFCLLSPDQFASDRIFLLYSKFQCRFLKNFLKFLSFAVRQTFLHYIIYISDNLYQALIIVSKIDNGPTGTCSLRSIVAQRFA